MATVGDLVLVDAWRLTRLPGLTGPAKIEVHARAKLWRSRFGRRGRRWAVEARRAQLDDPFQCADMLLAPLRGQRNDRAVVLASMLLGLSGSVGANATQAELSAAVRPPVTAGRISQLFATLQDRWADDDAARTLLDVLGTAVDQRLSELGGVPPSTSLPSIC